MKIIYEFDPYEDKDELEVFQKASLNSRKLDDIYQYVRALNKYDERTEIPIEELATKINQILSED